MSECGSETEWIMLNDDQVGFVRGNWPKVITMCMEQQAYPSILFYEKEENDFDAVVYEPSPGFSRVSREIEKLKLLASRIEAFYSEREQNAFDQGRAASIDASRQRDSTQAPVKTETE